MPFRKEKNLSKQKKFKASILRNEVETNFKNFNLKFNIKISKFVIKN